MAKKKSVIIIGSVTIDTVIQNKKKYKKIGGVVSYAGLTFIMQGISPGVITNIAQNDTTVISFFKKNAIHLYTGETPETTRFINIINQDQRHQKVTALADPIQLKPYTPLIQKTTHVHLGPLFPSDIAVDQIDCLSPNRHFVSLDVQGYVRDIRNGIVFPNVSPHLPSLLHLADIIKADYIEMEAICDYFKLTLKQLQQKFTLAEILVTNGSQGGYISSRNGQQTFYQAHPVDKVVDPTGAGDIFFAAYLAQRYHNRKSITFSLDHAALVTADYLEGKWDLSGGKITDVNKKTNYTQGE